MLTFFFLVLFIFNFLLLYVAFLFVVILNLKSRISNINGIHVSSFVRAREREKKPSNIIILLFITIYIFFFFFLKFTFYILYNVCTYIHIKVYYQERNLEFRLSTGDGRISITGRDSKCMKANDIIEYKENTNPQTVIMTPRESNPKKKQEKESFHDIQMRQSWDLTFFGLAEIIITSSWLLIHVIIITYYDYYYYYYFSLSITYTYIYICLLVFIYILFLLLLRVGLYLFF